MSSEGHGGRISGIRDGERGEKEKEKDQSLTELCVGRWMRDDRASWDSSPDWQGGKKGIMSLVLMNNQGRVWCWGTEKCAFQLVLHPSLGGMKSKEEPCPTCNP